MVISNVVYITTKTCEHHVWGDYWCTFIEVVETLYGSPGVIWGLWAVSRILSRFSTAKGWEFIYAGLALENLV